MSDLVKRLATGTHPVSAMRYKTPDEFQEAVGRGFVLIKFTKTKGGTELGFKIDQEKSKTDFDSGDKVHLVGPLTLDYQPVECSVDIDIKTLEGTGALILTEVASESKSKLSTESGTSKVAKKAKAKTQQKGSAKKVSKKRTKKTSKATSKN